MGGTREGVPIFVKPDEEEEEGEDDDDDGHTLTSGEEEGGKEGLLKIAQDLPHYLSAH